MLRIGVLVSGGGTNLQAIIDEIENGHIKNVRIVSVVSNKPDAYALERAQKHGIEPCSISPRNFDTRAEYDKALRDYFIDKKIDLIVMAGFLVVVGPALIHAFPNRIMNIHPSLIPAFCGDGYYGKKVHQEVLDKGVKITGATVHFVDEGTDTGPIILQKAVEVQEDDTPETLQKRVMEEAEWKIYPEAIRLFAEERLHVEERKVKIR